MSKSAIEWTEDTWNPIVGCSILSPGCTNCYAMKMAARIEAMNANALPGHGSAPQYAGTTRKVNGHAVWTGKLALAGDNILLQPLKRKKPTTYFVNSMGDLFHEDVPDGWIDKVFAVMVLAPQHTFQVLTKRAKRMWDYFREPIIRMSEIHRACEIMGYKFPDEIFDRGLDQPLPNVWLGVSTERQQEADERIPLLLQTPAAIRFISAEPLLGPINLTSINHRGVVGGHSALHDRGLGKLDWVIVGGESGPDARPMHPDWARSLKVQCEAAGVPFFFKQWGEYKAEMVPGTNVDLKYLEPNQRVGWGDGKTNHTLYTRVGKKLAGRALDGIEYNAMPVAR